MYITFPLTSELQARRVLFSSVVFAVDLQRSKLPIERCSVACGGFLGSADCTPYPQAKGRWLWSVQCSSNLHHSDQLYLDIYTQVVRALPTTPFSSSHPTSLHPKRQSTPPGQTQPSSTCSYMPPVELLSRPLESML